MAWRPASFMTTSSTQPRKIAAKSILGPPPRSILETCHRFQLCGRVLNHKERPSSIRGLQRMFPHTPVRRQLHQAWHTSRLWYSIIVEPEFQSSIDLPASNHHDLPSFLNYASRVGADPHSSVYVGTVYEYTVQAALARLGMSLKRVGGKSDYGIDLFGTWSIPSAASDLKVLVQCKARGAKSKPSEIRELEGAFVGAPSGWRGTGVLGFLVSQQEATKGVREAIGRSRWPMGYVMCTSQGKILQMLWNRNADDEGLLGAGVTVKYVGGDKDDKEIVLLWPKNATVGPT